MKTVSRILLAVDISSLVATGSHWAGYKRSAVSNPAPTEVASSMEELPENFLGRLEALDECATIEATSAKASVSLADLGSPLQVLRVVFDSASTIWPVDPEDAHNRWPHIVRGGLMQVRDRSPQRSGEGMTNDHVHERLGNTLMADHPPLSFAERPEVDPCLCRFFRQPLSLFRTFPSTCWPLRRCGYQRIRP